MRGVLAQVQSGLGFGAALLAAALFGASPLPASAATGLTLPAAAGGQTAGDTSHIRLAAEEIPPPPRPKPAYKGSIKTSGAWLTAHLAEDTPALETAVSWRVTRYDGLGGAIESTDSRAQIELPPGVYRAHATAGLATAEAEFTVNFDEVTKVHVPLGAGALEVTVDAEAAPMALERAHIRIRRASAENNDPTLEEVGSQFMAILPAGDYDIEAELGTVSGRTTASVETGSTTEADVELVVGHIIAEAIASEGSEPLSNATFSLGWPESDPASGDAIARTIGRHGIFTVAPGQYKLAAEFGLASSDLLVRVNANRLTTVTMSLNAARLALDAISPDTGAGVGAGSPARYRIFQAGAQGSLEPIAEADAALPVFRLPAGEFTVEAERDGLIARETVVLEPGRPTSQQLVLGAGTVLVTPTSHGRPLEAAEIWASAVPLSDTGTVTGPALNLGRLASAHLSLPAGRYRLTGRLEPGGATAEAEFTLVAGAQEPANLDFEVGTARLQVVSKPGGEPLTTAHVILHPARGGEPTKMIGGDLEVSLTPGVYKVVAGSGAQTAEGELAIIAGNTATLELVPK